STIDTATTILRALQPAIRDNGMPPALMRFPEVRRNFLKSPVVLAPAADGPSYMRTPYMQPLLLLFGIVALVLLVPCAHIRQPSTRACHRATARDERAAGARCLPLASGAAVVH